MQYHGQQPLWSLEDYESVLRFPKHYSRPYVPLTLQDPKAMATFRKELVNAVTCCEAVEQTPWTPLNANAVLMRARGRKGLATVRTVSLPSEPSCTQRFMAFEANEGGLTTYIIAFRSDRECFNDIVSTPGAAKEVENDNTFKVHKSLWWRAATMPLQSLPPQWRMGLREHGHRLILTGFSIGGAVAAVATLQLLEEEYDISKQICCYTFGTPLQGDQNYANRINQKYVSNFYHVVIDGDPIPGVLTLVSKVAEKQPTICSYVVNCISKLLTVSAQVAAGVAINSVAPGAGAILELASQIDFLQLGKDIMSLIATELYSPMPLPEYKFGGSLVVLYLPNMRPNSDAQMTFVPLLDDGRVLEDVFSLRKKHTTSNIELQNGNDLHQLKTFSQVINDLDYSNLMEAIRSAPAEQQHRSGQFSQIMDHSLDHVKDGAGRASNAAKAAARCILSPRAGEDQSSSSEYLLQPYFSSKKPIEVCVDKHDITIEVYGENMVLGMNVLYKVNGKEKLRIPCLDNYLPHLGGKSKDPQKSMQQSLVHRPLQFSTQGTKGLSFKEDGGLFVVQLAFGSMEVAASTVNTRMFNSLNLIQVAERFSTEQPSKLIDLLLFWGVATAQALCTAAFYAIKDKPRDAADVVSKIITELSEVPQTFLLLDRLLKLVDTSHVPIAVLDELPADMSRTLHRTTTDAVKDAVKDTAKDAAKSNVIVPYFLADNESASWTFGGCFKRTIDRLITKDMLSKKESAEKLSKNLEEDIAGPLKMVRAYLDHQFKYKEYGKEFSSKQISKWKKEKEVAKTAVDGTFVGGAVLPVVNIPIVGAGLVWESDFLLYMGLVIGAPTGFLAGGLVGAAWWLTHAAMAPVHRMQKRPGLMADMTRTTHLADNWEKKLQAAATLFECKTEPPYVACKLEYELYRKCSFPKEGCYNYSSKTGKKSRYEEAVVLQMANFGLAGALVYEIRRYLTKRKTALGLIGSTQAGKSTFASLAFQVDSNPGARMEARTRVLRHWTLDLPLRRNQQFTLIDFPGSTDQAASHWYIRGQVLANVLMVVVSLKEINSSQAVALVKMACQARSNDKEVSVLFCFTLADVAYENYRDEAEEMSPQSTAKQLFIENFDTYTKELIDAASVEVSNTDQMKYIRSNMHACCFKPSLQDGTNRQAQELESANVKNVQWVKNWCEKSLLAINE